MVDRIFPDFVPENRGNRRDKICKYSVKHEILAPFNYTKMNFSTCGTSTDLYLKFL